MDTNKMRDDLLEQASNRLGDDKGQGLDPYFKDAFRRGWEEAWRLSREAVVVELPSACAYEGLTQHLGSVIELTYEAPEHDPVGLARLPDVRAAIEAQGLRVAP